MSLPDRELTRSTDGRPERAPSSPAPGRASAPDVTRVLALQRSAGNAAVSQMLARFVGSEHEQLGNTTHTAIDLGNGVVLTWGEVVALAGDEYGSVEELLADTRDPAGKARLRAALEHDGIPGAIAATLPRPTAAQVSAHDTKYIQLAMTNVTHFPDAGAAVNEWAKHHAAAIELAVQAGLANNPAGMQMAYLEEAFGEHFLTDCFSGGHVRTPRTQIVDFYTHTFAPRVAQPLVDNLRTRLIDALFREARPQTDLPDGILRGQVQDQVNPGVAAAIAGAGGMPALTEFIGLGVAGAISGAMHDQEGAAGVMVASDAHPEPWRAYGDTGLAKSPVSREEATKAIEEAKQQVDAAFLIGQQEGVARATAIAEDPPAVVHFAFNSSGLDPAGTAAVAGAAAYMAYRPEAVVQITGHTDPIGSDGDNDVLGQARADAVARGLSAGGVAPDRVHTGSMGEKLLLTRDPKQYSRNRRAELAWATGAGRQSGTPGPSDTEQATVRAMAKANRRADTTLVLRFVPRPVEERAHGPVAGGNAALPEWHWGRIDASFRTAVDDWIRTMVGTKLEAALDGVPQLDPQTSHVPITGTAITVHPRDRAKEIVRALLANPTRELGDLTGTPAGP